MLDDTTDYCETTIVTSLNLTLWTTSNMDSACEDAATVVSEDCTDTAIIDQDCYACAYAVSYIFTKYESYVLSALETTYTTISEDSAAAL